MKAQTRIVIIDDNQDIHDVVKKLVSDAGDLLLVGQAFDGDSGLKLCQVAKPDLVLMDVVMPIMSGAETTAAILRSLPDTKILALSSFHEYEQIQRMLQAGAIGYLVKGGIAQDLISTIRSIMQGNIVLSPQAAQAVLTIRKTDTLSSKTSPNFGLTDRETQVLKLLADGLTYNGIANALHISPPTVRFHVNNIQEKLGCETRSEVLVLAARHKLI